MNKNIKSKIKISKYKKIKKELDIYKRNQKKEDRINKLRNTNNKTFLICFNNNEDKKLLERFYDISNKSEKFVSISSLIKDAMVNYLRLKVGVSLPKLGWNI